MDNNYNIHVLDNTYIYEGLFVCLPKSVAADVCSEIGEIILCDPRGSYIREHGSNPHRKLVDLVPGCCGAAHSVR